MANEPSRKPSFSIRQRWGIFFSVLVSIAAVFALVVMVNYLGARYYLQFPWNMQTRKELSSQTVNLVKNLTNDINVVVYYNKNDRLYDLVKGLLDQYRELNRDKISVRTVNYLADPTAAAKIREAYGNYLDPLVDTNAVIFASATGTNVVSGEILSKSVIEPVGEAEKHEFRDKLASFNGEACFTDAMFKVINGRAVRAYFFDPPGAFHRLDGQDKYGYQKFRAELQNIDIDLTNLTTLHGSNAVPADCKMLVIAPGPNSLDYEAAANVERYLEHGGHLFVLFNFSGRKYFSGLEPVLARWGIAVGHDVVRDFENHYSDAGDVVVKTFNKGHPAVNRLDGLELVLPRTIGTTSKADEMDSSAVKQLAWTGTRATTNETSVTTGKQVPLMAAVEKGDVKGIADQGTTRILVVGDSFCLDNELIGQVPQNRAFARYAANWLVGQTQMLQGIPAQQIKEYTVKMTPTEAENIRWIFLAGMPGAILLLGGLVWLRRRH